MLPRVPSPALPCAAAAAILALALASCGTTAQFAPACPKTGFLSDAADLTQFRSAGTDITDMVVDGRITGGKLTCTQIDPDHLRAVLSVDMDLARGPAMQGRIADVTYFVSASRGTTILAKTPSTLHAEFERNGGKLRVTGEQTEIILPTPGSVTGADYRILVGFQLTPEQLAFNRRRGPR